MGRVKKRTVGAERITMKIRRGQMEFLRDVLRVRGLERDCLLGRTEVEGQVEGKDLSLWIVRDLVRRISRIKDSTG